MVGFAYFYFHAVHKSTMVSDVLQSGLLNQNTIYLVPSYTFDCNGKVIRWESCLSPVDPRNDTLEMVFLVYRPSITSQCYSLVGRNVFHWHEKVSHGFCISCYQEQISQIQVNRGDVVAFYTSNSQVATSSALDGSTTTTLWHATLSTIRPAGDFLCSIKTGKMGNLSPSTVGLPLLKAITGIYTFNQLKFHTFPFTVRIIFLGISAISHQFVGKTTLVVRPFDSMLCFCFYLAENTSQCVFTSTCVLGMNSLQYGSCTSPMPHSTVTSTSTCSTYKCELPQDESHNHRFYLFWIVELTIPPVAVLFACISGIAIFVTVCKITRRMHAVAGVVVVRQEPPPDYIVARMGSRQSTTSYADIDTTITTWPNTAYESTEADSMSTTDEKQVIRNHSQFMNTFDPCPVYAEVDTSAMISTQHNTAYGSANGASVSTDEVEPVNPPTDHYTTAEFLSRDNTTRCTEEGTRLSTRQSTTYGAASATTQEEHIYDEPGRRRENPNTMLLVLATQQYQCD